MSVYSCLSHFDGMSCTQLEANQIKHAPQVYELSNSVVTLVFMFQDQLYWNPHEAYEALWQMMECKGNSRVARFKGTIVPRNWLKHNRSACGSLRTAVWFQTLEMVCVQALLRHVICVIHIYIILYLCPNAQTHKKWMYKWYYNIYVLYIRHMLCTGYTPVYHVWTRICLP